MRRTARLRWSSETSPSSTAFFSRAPKYSPVGISMSSPASSEAPVLCVAPQSDITQPVKPHSSRSSVVSRSVFSHEKAPLTEL